MENRQFYSPSVRSLGRIFRELSAAEAEKAVYDIASANIKGTVTDRDRTSLFRLQLCAAVKMSAQARVYCAKAYLHGVGTPQSDKYALRWARKAAVQGDPEGQNIFAFMLATGRGLPYGRPDQRLATEFYRRSARQGNQDSLFPYGMRLYEGIGVRADEVEGKRWIIRAAECNNSEALENLRCIEVFGMPINRALAVYGPEL